MKYFSVYDKETGKLISTGTVIADPLPENYVAVEVGDYEDSNWEGDYDWDEKLLTFVPKPPENIAVFDKDAFIQEIINDPLLDILTPEEKDKLSQVLNNKY